MDDKASSNPPGAENVPFDLFSYPRLYPSGWDLSELAKEPEAPEPEPMPKLSELFREPRPFPPGWDPA